MKTEEELQKELESKTLDELCVDDVIELLRYKYRMADYSLERISKELVKKI